ncbi:hypothetical protein ACHI29_15155 [Listeria monocytogenes]
MKKQVRLKILKLDAKKSVGILTQQAREEIAMIQKGNEKIGDELKIIQDKLADAFESQVHNPV